jgi:protein-tyrosine phosphatase
MASLAAKKGIKAIIATPHSNIPGVFENYWTDLFDEKIQTLNTEISKRGIDIKIYPGQEIFCHGDVLSKLKSGDLITLNKSRYVLLEFDFKTQEAEAYSAVKELASFGYVPIVAHPERYAFAFENSASILKLKKYGALIQLNAQSIIGAFGRYPKLVSEYILEKYPFLTPFYEFHRIFSLLFGKKKDFKNTYVNRLETVSKSDYDHNLLDKLGLK